MFCVWSERTLIYSIARSIRYEPKQQCRESHSLLTPTCIYDTNFFIIFNFKFITAAYSGPIRWRIGKGPWPPAKCQGIDNITILFLFIIFYIPLAAVMFREVFLYPLRCKSPIKTINYTRLNVKLQNYLKKYCLIDKIPQIIGVNRQNYLYLGKN